MMQITKLVFSGTPDEFETVSHLFTESQVASTVIKQDSLTIATVKLAANEDLIRHVLKRISLPLGQQDLFKALYSAGDSGLKKNELAVQTHRTDKEVNGVLGALGRRVNSSAPELENAKLGIELLLDIERTTDGEWLYRLRPEFRKVLADLNPDWLHTKKSNVKRVQS